MTIEPCGNHSHVAVECTAMDRTRSIFDDVVNVPWQMLFVDGPCSVTITNHGPEVVVVEEPSGANGHMACRIVPKNSFGGQLPTELRRRAHHDRVVIDCVSFDLTSIRTYAIPFRADNLFGALDALEKEYRLDATTRETRDYNRRRREIQVACRAQASIAGFPQGAVRSYTPDPPDILIEPTAHHASNDPTSEKTDGCIGVELSELVDQGQHEAFLHAKATVCAAAQLWKKLTRPATGQYLRLDYRITDDLIARLKVGSGPKDKKRIIDEAVHIIERCVHEFLRHGATGPVESRLISHAWNPKKRKDRATKVIDVTVSASSSPACEIHYYHPVSGIQWSKGRFFNTLGEDVTLDAPRLQKLISHKTRKIERCFPRKHPFSSLVLFLAGEYFPAGSSQSGSFGILHVGDEHPDRDCRFDIAPFSRVYVGQESSCYMIDESSGRFTKVQAS